MRRHGIALLGLAIVAIAAWTYSVNYNTRIMLDRVSDLNERIALERENEPESHVGKTHHFRIMQLRRGGEDLVLSRRAILDERRSEEAKAVRATLIEGAVIKAHGDSTGTAVLRATFADEELQEWLEDKDNPKNQHRHVSHLWGVHPGDDITWKEHPEMWRAARQSLVYRGDAATGYVVYGSSNGRGLPPRGASRIRDPDKRRSESPGV